MPTATVVRPVSTAPPLGVNFGFAYRGKTFRGVVLAVRPLSRTHVAVEVEIDDAEFARLRDTEQSD